VLRLGGFAVVLLVLFAMGLLFAPHSAHRLRHELGGLGAWAPVAMSGAYAVLTCAFVPGSVLAGPPLRADRAGDVVRADQLRRWHHGHRDL
jgi:uncharacterized membrane protein YdjX (TVP38/TMEM64 family)